MSNTNPQPLDAREATEQAARFREVFDRLKKEVHKVFVGHDELVENVLSVLLTDGHVLLEGVPGLGKTLLARTLASALRLAFSRVQFTPDLMPSDIVGTMVLHEKEGGGHELRFVEGPLVANFILADEINRATPKTQSALLEAMQERQISVSRHTVRLPEPFIVVATQNPIEQEGTYPLPEAQLDRFMFNTSVDYPAEEEEFEIVKRTTADIAAEVKPTLSGERILALQKIVRRVPVADHVIRYALRLVRLTRREKGDVPPFIRDYVNWGAGPRASQYLVLGAKARAVLHGRFYANTDDVRSVAYPVLRHRILTNFNAEAEGIKPDTIIRRLIDTVAVEERQAGDREKLPKVFRTAGE